MSDDSHGVDQVGTNYGRLLAYVKKAGIDRIYYVDEAGERKDSRFPKAGISSIALTELEQLPFWATLD